MILLYMQFFQAAVVDDAVSSEEPCAKRACPAPTPPSSSTDAEAVASGKVVNCESTAPPDASSSTGDISSTVAEQ